MFLSSISPAHAEADIDFSAIPQNLADKMGISLFAGQLLCSCILMLIFLLPIALITRKRGTSWVLELVFGLLGMSVCIALTWLPYWLPLVVVLICAGLWSNKISGWLGGRS